MKYINSGFYLEKNPRRRKTVMMSPAEYLRIVRRAGRDDGRYNLKTVGKIIERLENNDPIDPLFLQYAGKKIDYADGSHRAVASVIMEIRKIPVEVVRERSFSYKTN